MAEFDEFSFESTTCTSEIHVLRCTPSSAPKGIVQIAHGIAEHIDRYRPFMQFLAEHGFLVVGNDHLGHGKSITGEGKMGYFADRNGWDFVVRDMAKLHDLTVSQYPNLPYILFGHSMGSFLTRTYMIRYPEKYDYAILSGTGHQSRLLIGSGCLMSDLICLINGADSNGDTLSNIAFGTYLNRIENPRTDYDWLSTVDSEVDKYVADPLCGFTAKSGLYRDMMHGLSFITDKDNIDKMDKTKPVYFMSGAEDPVGDYGKGVEKAYKAFRDAGCTDVKMKLYPGGRHEMLNERNHEEVFSDILNWIESKI